MCGILGVIERSSQHVVLDDAIELVKHRGPFNQGTVRIKNVTLFMNQLPMTSSARPSLPVCIDDTYVAYNGELYEEFSEGCSLETEVVTLLKNIDNMRHPNGMFACAIYSTKNDQLILARDQFGMKPLYLYIDEVRVIFCSEIEPILCILKKVSLRKEVICEIFLTGGSLDNKTPFEGIDILPPGKKMIFDINSWKLIDAGNIQYYEENTEDMPFEYVLADAVKKCSNSAKELGLMLSDGVDSNLINSFLPKKFRKFSLYFKDDLEPKHKLENLFNIENNDEVFFDLFEKAIHAYGMPTRMTSIIMYQQLAEFIAKEGIHGVLLGEGADEMFLGYPRHVEISNNYRAFDSGLLNFYFSDFYSKRDLVISPIFDGIKNSIKNIATKLSKMTLRDAIYYLELKYSLEPLLRRADHILMRKTIEGRLPYLDKSVVAFAKKTKNEQHSVQSNKPTIRELAKLRSVSQACFPKSHFRIDFKYKDSIKNLMVENVLNNESFFESMGIVLTTLDSIPASDIFTLYSITIWERKFSKYL
jgi:asparagine synthase (glutamine-hydrolysing)